MQLRAFVISVVIALLAVQSSASSTVSWQANPKGDVISGEWAAVINRPSRNVPITFKLKLDPAGLAERLKMTIHQVRWLKSLHVEARQVSVRTRDDSKR